MDQTARHERLARIERRQSLVLSLLVGLYLLVAVFGVAELVGYWISALLAVLLGVLAVAVVVARRRRNR